MYRAKRAKAAGWKRSLVVLIIAMNVVFTLAILWLVWLGRQEPSTLILSWFGFTTAELVTLATLAVKEGNMNAHNGSSDYNEH